MYYVNSAISYVSGLFKGPEPFSIIKQYSNIQATNEAAAALKHGVEIVQAAKNGKFDFFHYTPTTDLSQYTIVKQESPVILAKTVKQPEAEPEPEVVVAKMPEITPIAAQLNGEITALEQQFGVVEVDKVMRLFHGLTTEKMVTVKSLLEQRARMDKISEKAIQDMNLFEVSSAHRPLENGALVMLTVEARMALYDYTTQLERQELGDRTAQPVSPEGKIRLVEIMRQYQKDGNATPFYLELESINKALGESPNPSELADLEARKRHLLNAANILGKVEPESTTKEKALPSSYKEYYVFGKRDKLDSLVVVRVLKVKNDNQRNQYANDFKILVWGNEKNISGQPIQISEKVRSGELLYKSGLKIKHQYFLKNIEWSVNSERTKKIPEVDRLIAISGARSLARYVLFGGAITDQALMNTIDYFNAVPRDQSYASDPVFVEAMKQADEIQGMMGKSLLKRKQNGC